MGTAADTKEELNADDGEMRSRWHTPLVIGVLLLASVLISACASSSDTHIISMAEAPSLSRSRHISNARLLVTTSTKNGEAPSADDVDRDTNLAATIRSLNLFSSVEVSRYGIARWCEPIAKLSVTRVESGEIDTGRLFGETAKTIFTLGLAAPSHELHEHLRSTVQLDLQRWDGAHKVYESSGDAVVEYESKADGAALQRQLTTRVTAAALKRLLDDPGFYRMMLDKLKVTKPKALRPPKVAQLFEKVEAAAQPFTLAALYQGDDPADCVQGLCVASEAGMTEDGAKRLITRAASPSMGRYTVVSDGAVPSIFSPSEIPINSRIMELSNPVAASERTPFGFCEVVTYDHSKNTRTIYTACDQAPWTARRELCNVQK